MAPGISRALDLLGKARVATLATLGTDGRPHLVPIVFALDVDDLVSAVDGKPKTGPVLTRIRNIEREPLVSVLAHHYDEEWSRLWWVRVDGLATIEAAGADFERSLIALRQRYPQYESVALDGPLIRIEIQQATTWMASPND